MTPQARQDPGGREYLSRRCSPGFQQMPLPEQVQPRAPITPPGQFPANDAAVSDYTAGADTAGSDDTLSPRTPQPSQPLPQTNQFRQPNPAPNQFVQPSHQTIRHGQTAPMPDNFQGSRCASDMVNDNYVAIVPAGMWHRLTNIGLIPLKLYSIM